MIKNGNGSAPVRSERQPDAAILAFSGSSRDGSFNRRLLDIAVGEASALGADVTVLDLRDLDLPVFDPNIGMRAVPQGVLLFRQVLSANDGLLIISPEYNGSLSPLLKNALDWSSLATFGGGGLEPYRGKVGSIMSASMNRTGGLSCLNHLRSVLSRMGVLVLPDELSLPSASSAFSDTQLRDPAMRNLLHKQIVTLVGVLRLFRNGAELS